MVLLLNGKFSRSRHRDFPSEEHTHGPLGMVESVDGFNVDVK
jgi:hypothetical protein